MIEEKELTEQDRIEACEQKITDLTERVRRLEELLTNPSEGGLARAILSKTE